MTDTNRINLLGRIERYIRRSGTKPTRFGRDVALDPRLVFDLRKGRTPRPRTVARITAYLDELEGSAGPAA